MNIYKREWPKKGYMLYSMSDEPEAVHMSFVPSGKVDAAVLMRINWKKDRTVVLAVKGFTSEKDAVTWYVEEKQKFDAH